MTVDIFALKPCTAARSLSPNMSPDIGTHHYANLYVPNASPVCHLWCH